VRKVCAQALRVAGVVDEAKEEEVAVRVRMTLVAATAALFAMASGGVAQATPNAPGWIIDTVPAPTSFSAADNERCLASLGDPRGRCDAYEVWVTNVGNGETDGSPITLQAQLPAGLTVQKISFFWSGAARLAEFLPGFEEGTDLNVKLSEELGAPLCSTEPVQCTFPELPFPIRPDERLRMVVYVTVAESAAEGPLTAAASVSGGGVPSVSTTVDNQISSKLPAFGPSGFDFHIAAPDGTTDRIAGDHPYELTTTIDLASKIEPPAAARAITSVEDVKDVIVDLPPGFVGSTLAAPECSLAQLSTEARCPVSTEVGKIYSESVKAVEVVNGPIYNLVPEHGVPAEFGFIDSNKNVHVFTAQLVGTPQGYRLQVHSQDIPQAVLYHIAVTFYGNPAEKDGLATESAGGEDVPFFTNPTNCSGEETTASIHIDSWQHPAPFNSDATPDLADPRWRSMSSGSGKLTSCNELAFGPEVLTAPTSAVADSPSGLNYELKVPQPEVFGVKATPNVNSVTVSLAEGLTLNPASGDGLAGCSIAQIGWLGGAPNNFNSAPAQCPEPAKVGTVELRTPLIGGVLSGAVYVANQNENPFGSVFALYIVIDDRETGIRVKLAGEVKTDPTTGRITTVFADSPQLPFSDFKLHLSEGSRANLATPETCGNFAISSDLSAWSAPFSGPDSILNSSFAQSTGCVGGFAPTFSSGSTSVLAGGFTSVITSFGRSDSDQELGGVSVRLPAGLLADIATVPLCPDAGANTGTCPASSRIGTVQAQAGPGATPITETGTAYLTGHYKSAPYGIVAVIPAVAGPFNFGNVIVRQQLVVDPADGHVTDVSDPLPLVLDATGANGQTSGVPIRLRHVDVVIDRPNFAFNPTNCSRLAVTGTLTGTGGATGAVQTPFQAGGCAALKFAPTLIATTSAHTSRLNGASLTTKLTYPSGPLGTYANIAKVKVVIPKQLPARNTTLQKACRAVVFEANPAACPAGSVVGHAKVVTPILPAPLEGPAYFVSHGGEEFPSLTIVLQGNGITIDLVGSTFIRKGVITTTFKAVPDAPVKSFELTLPEGRFSALGAVVNLCTVRGLAMPTSYVAQNGAELQKTTPIHVTGCAAPKKHHGHRKKHKAAGARHG
jgi:hypothetical protein